MEEWTDLGRRMYISFIKLSLCRSYFLIKSKNIYLFALKTWGTRHKSAIDICNKTKQEKSRAI